MNLSKIITFVKKIKANGEPCRKCMEVEDRLHKDGWYRKIDCIAFADERDNQSEGMQLAAKHGIEQAPFFVVEEPNQTTRVYTIYLKFVREELATDKPQEVSDRQAEAIDLLQAGDDLDML